MSQILLVDDEFSLSELTKEYLEAKDFNVLLCHQAGLAIDILYKHDVQLCILDVKMPEKDGFTLASEIRNKFPEMPFIFLTGQTLKEDRIKGFTIGADDYIAKPFSMEELYLRILVILKRHQTPEFVTSANKRYKLGELVFQTELRELQFGALTMRLTAIENKLLMLLCENLNQTLGRDLALISIWGDNDIYKGRSMNVYINKLRKKISAEPRLEILNAHGEGYCLSFRESE